MTSNAIRPQTQYRLASLYLVENPSFFAGYQVTVKNLFRQCQGSFIGFLDVAEGL